MHNNFIPLSHLYNIDLLNYYYNDSQMRDACYSNDFIKLNDYGPNPTALNIKEATKKNNTLRTALWTGNYLQLTLMSLEPGDDIGLEIHNNHDQFIRIEQGQGLVKMGDNRDQLVYQKQVYDGYAIFIPAGKWHNLINTGTVPLKLYSIYAPPEHPHGTVHQTKRAVEGNYRY